MRVLAETVSTEQQQQQQEQQQRQQQRQFDTYSLGVKLNLDQACVYASQRRMCITAALVKAFQEVEEGLLQLAKPTDTALSPAPAPQVRIVSALQTCLVQGVCST